MDEFEYDEENLLSAEGRRFLPVDFAVLGLDLARGVVSSAASTLQLAQTLAASHANSKNAQHAFMEDAALEIESMTNGETDG